MIGIVIVTHGDLALEFIRAVGQITGPQMHMKAVSICADDDREVKRQEVLSAISDVNQGKGVILLTDLMGGTPSNLAMASLGNQEIDVIAGINLPILLKIVNLRGKIPLNQLVEQAAESGRKSIQVASTLLQPHTSQR